MTWALRSWVVSLAALATACAGGSAALPPSQPTGPPGWLSTVGNRIVTFDGKPWMGRGVNIYDTRSCGACVLEPPTVAEVNRRIDEAVDSWGATFLRLNLESYAASGGRVQWRGVLDDPGYLADLQAIVRHVGRKPGVYVLVSLWTDPTIDDMGRPTADTARVWEKLAGALKSEPQVMFGVVNEPTANVDGSADARVWEAMNNVVAAIRGIEDAAGTPHHLVAVQGTRQWARVLDYYVKRPIAAGGGLNVIYETHVYDSSDKFQQRFVDPARTLPVIIGEFGTVNVPGVATMTLGDCSRLMDRADVLGVPYVAWAFHMRCPPNLLEDLSSGGCGVGMPLRPTALGQLVREHLSRR